MCEIQTLYDVLAVKPDATVHRLAVDVGMEEALEIISSAFMLGQVDEFYVTASAGQYSEGAKYNL